MLLQANLHPARTLVADCGDAGYRIAEILLAQMMIPVLVNMVVFALKFATGVA